jgi:class 3 adenylate cyclase
MLSWPGGYWLVERSEWLSRFISKRGIRLKLTLIVSFILILFVILFVSLYTVISSKALISANDKLCETIAGNISATEAILTAEDKPIKRSLILQDIVSGLAKSRINGLEYAAVYDLNGMLVERKGSYAAHTDIIKRATKIPARLLNELKNVDAFEKKPIVYLDQEQHRLDAFQYRLPLNFFNTKVGVIEIVFSAEAILGPVKSARIFIIFFSAALLVLGIGITVVIAKGVVSPIIELSEAMTKVGAGDLEITMDIRRHDELGDLSREFNTMVMHLREKLQLQKFVSGKTISMIREKAASGNIGLGGKREKYAFLFSDIRGFTAMSEKMEPEDVVGILNAYFDLQAKIIKKHDGDIDKFVGDQVMAVFSGEAMADNALECAIEIIREINHLNTAKRAAGLIAIEVGIGLNLGEVIHGRIGSSDRMDNTSIGDAVNLAARLCSHAEAKMILASKALMDKASRKKFSCNKPEPIRVKGKANPVEIFEITGLR